MNQDDTEMINKPKSKALNISTGSLFKVRVTFETVVLADSPKEATDLFKFGMGEADDPPSEVCCAPIKSKDQLPKGWCGRCLPWGHGNKEEKDVFEILSENNEDSHAK
jgi:hypothetical protein